MPAQELTRGIAGDLPREMVGFLNQLVKFVNGLKGGPISDAPPFAVAITSDDAIDDATVWALANELKADVNLLIAYVNLFAENVNNLQASLRAAGLLEEE